jgi:hypothetical protein
MSVVDPQILLQAPPEEGKSSRRTRAMRFGAGIALLGVALALFFWLKRGEPRLGAAVAGASVALLVLFTAFPGLALGVRWAWMGFAHVLGRINTTLLLSLLYVLFIVPWSLALRISGRTGLRPPSGPSYFRRRSAQHGREHFERPY